MLTHIYNTQQTKSSASLDRISANEKLRHSLYANANLTSPPKAETGVRRHHTLIITWCLLPSLDLISTIPLFIISTTSWS